MSIHLLTDTEQAKIEADIRTIMLGYVSQHGGVSEMARTMSVVYDRAWNQMNRNQGVRAGFLAAYVIATGDRRPLDLLAETCGFRVAMKACCPSLLKNVHQELVQLSIDCGRTQEMIEGVYADRRVTEQEYRRVHTLCNKYISLISMLDEKVKKDSA